MLRTSLVLSSMWPTPMACSLALTAPAAYAIDRYRFFLRHDARRRALGAAARKRALAEHTYRHRAIQLVKILREHL